MSVSFYFMASDSGTAVKHLLQKLRVQFPPLLLAKGEKNGKKFLIFNSIVSN
jgi:hypothetical protein